MWMSRRQQERQCFTVPDDWCSRTSTGPRASIWFDMSWGLFTGKDEWVWGWRSESIQSWVGKELFGVRYLTTSIFYTTVFIVNS